MFFKGQESTIFYSFISHVVSEFQPKFVFSFSRNIRDECNNKRLRAQLLAYAHLPTYPIRIANHAPLRPGSVR